MPATGPIPGEVGKCFQKGNSNKYGRNLVSTAGYMFAGSDKVDIGSCAAIKPASGYDGTTTMTLVRNPNYSAATDTKSARENLPGLVRLHRQLERRRHLQQDRSRATSRTRSRARRRR